MNNVPEKICGIFSNKQLNRPLKHNPNFKMSKKVASILSGMMLLNSVSELSAQEVTDYQKQKDALAQNSNSENSTIKIRGKLLDPNDEPIENAQINVNNIITVYSDSKGYFNAEIKEKDILNHCNFYVQSDEHGNRQFPYLKKDLSNLITLKYLKIELQSCNATKNVQYATAGGFDTSLSNFERNSYKLLDKHKSNLHNVGSVIKEYYPNEKIIVQGHTDGIENKELGLLRAKEMIKFLEELGVNINNLTPVNKEFSEPKNAKCLLNECTEKELEYERRVVFKLFN